MTITEREQSTGSSIPIKTREQPSGTSIANKTDDEKTDYLVIKDRVARMLWGLSPAECAKRQRQAETKRE